MKSLITTLLNRPEAAVGEKLSSILNLFSAQALTGLIGPKLKEVVDFSPHWEEASVCQLEAFIQYICDVRTSSVVSADIFAKFNDYDFLQSVFEETKNAELKAALDAYFKLFPKFAGDMSRAKDNHGYLAMFLSQSIRQVLFDLGEAKADEKMARPAKVGEVLVEGPGFEVILGHSKQAHVRYPEGNTSVVVMHDLRENHFLMVERFNSITGLYTLEFPRISSASPAKLNGVLNSEFRELTGLPYRNLEKIGQIMPESHVIEGVCEVYYGNYDLEENHSSENKLVRSLKRMTKEGLFQAAYEGRVECGVTLSAISVWQAFEGVRKKRLANSQRVRNKPADDEDED